jgi:hypothetical protein
MRVDFRLNLAVPEGLKITRNVWDSFAKHGIAEETAAAVVQGLREKAEEFRKGGGEIYRRA